MLATVGSGNKRDWKDTGQRIQNVMLAGNTFNRSLALSNKQIELLKTESILVFTSQE